VAISRIVEIVSCGTKCARCDTNFNSEMSFIYEIWVSHSGGAEDSSLLGCLTQRHLSQYNPLILHSIRNYSHDDTPSQLFTWWHTIITIHMTHHHNYPHDDTPSQLFTWWHTITTIHMTHHHNCSHDTPSQPKKTWIFCLHFQSNFLFHKIHGIWCVCWCNFRAAC